MKLFSVESIFLNSVQFNLLFLHSNSKRMPPNIFTLWWFGWNARELLNMMPYISTEMLVAIALQLWSYYSPLQQNTADDPKQPQNSSVGVWGLSLQKDIQSWNRPCKQPASDLPGLQNLSQYGTRPASNLGFKSSFIHSNEIFIGGSSI